MNLPPPIPPRLSAEATVLVGGPIPQTGAVGEEDVIEQRFAVGLFDPVHFLHQVSELLHIKVIHLDQVFNESPLVVRHLVVTLGFVKQTRRGMGYVIAPVPP